MNKNNTNAIPSIPPGVTLTTLDNGLTIIVREDHSAPVVSAQAWCAAGSIHEGKWLGAGLSHVLEHMLFKGTTTRPGSRIDQEVQEAGGYMNAYTSFDRTVYHIDVPNTGAVKAIDILCDIMQHATLPPDELAKEMDVIRREMDMCHDDPGRRASRRLFETAYTKSPYRFTIIGYPDIFNEVKPEDIRGYYTEKYAPNNVFFVVAGDVQERTRWWRKSRPPMPTASPGRCRRWCCRWNPGKPPRAKSSRNPPVELGHVHFAWHIPELRHADVPVLDVLSVLLGSGRSSRLFQQVREKQGLVHHVDAWTYSPGLPGLFGVSAMVDGDKFAAARDAILAEIEKVKIALGLRSDELQKAVKQFISATLSARKTMEGQAQNLGGNWLSANDLNFSERYLAAVKQVTVAEVQRVARHYLTPENRTLYALLPDGSAPKPSADVESNADHPIQKIELANGLKLLVKEDHRLPFVEFRAVFQGGVLAENAANNGTTMLLAKMLLKGTATRNAENIATEIESVGGHMDSYGGNNSFGVNAEVLSSDFATGLELAGRCDAAPGLSRRRTGARKGNPDRRHPLAQGRFAQERQPGHAPRAVWRRGLRSGFARHRGNRRPGVRGRFEGVPPKTGRAEQLRAGHLRRCENGGAQGGRGTGLWPMADGRGGSTSDLGPATRSLQARDRDARQEAGGAGHGLSRAPPWTTTTGMRSTWCRNVAATWDRGCSCASARSWGWRTMWARRISPGWCPVISPFTPAPNRPRRNRWKRNC